MKAFEKVSIVVSIVLCIFMAILILSSGTSTRIFTQTNESFSYTKVGNTVHFNDSLKNADFMECDLGDGRTMVIEPGEEFTHIYQDAGYYYMTFTAINEYDSDTYSKLIRVKMTT